MPSLAHWQLFDDQGRPIPSQSAHPDDVFDLTLLHASAHIWIWREGSKGPEILVQKRS